MEVRECNSNTPKLLELEKIQVKESLHRQNQVVFEELRTTYFLQKERLVKGIMYCVCKNQS